MKKDTSSSVEGNTIENVIEIVYLGKVIPNDINVLWVSEIKWGFGALETDLTGISREVQI